MWSWGTISVITPGVFNFQQKNTYHRNTHSNTWILVNIDFLMNWNTVCSAYFSRVYAFTYAINTLCPRMTGTVFGKMLKIQKPKSNYDFSMQYTTGYVYYFCYWFLQEINFCSYVLWQNWNPVGKKKFFRFQPNGPTMIKLKIAAKDFIVLYCIVLYCIVLLHCIVLLNQNNNSL